MNKILILGSKGMLGRQLMKVFGNNAIGWDKKEIDVSESKKLRDKIKKAGVKFDVIINCVAYNDVDAAEDNLRLALLLNAKVVARLAKICKEMGIILVHFSTNYVFDGKKGEYTELDIPNPQSKYAKTKYEGEIELAKNCHKYYLIRTAVLFGQKGESSLSKKSFVEIMLELSNKNKEIKVVKDEINSITYVKDLAEKIKLLINGKKPFGIYHIINGGQASWYDFAKKIFDISKQKVTLIPVLASEFKRKAKRPQRGVLLNTKINKLRPWQNALKDFLLLK